jgi:hypothetical protein
MVHDGTWTGAQMELTGVRAHRRCSGLELATATQKQSGGFTSSHQGLRDPFNDEARPTMVE